MIWPKVDDRRLRGNGFACPNSCGGHGARESRRVIPVPLYIEESGNGIRMNTGEILSSTYEIREEIGSGGGGTVYRAYHTRLKKDVVLKRIHRSTAGNEKEKEILKNLHHSGLPQVYDFLDAGTDIFTVIDYIPGESFDRLLKTGKKIPQKKAVKYAIQLCETVNYLHKQNPPILHGDIKPANIMLTPEDNICLIDFNISGVLDGKRMEVVGYTEGYGAPEQAALVAAVKEERALCREKSTAKREFPAGDRTIIHQDHTETMMEDAAADTVIEDGVYPAVNTEIEGDDYPAADTAIEGDDYSAADTAMEGSTDTAANQAANPLPLTKTTNPCVDVRADIYGIAATLYHFLTGIKPDKDPDKIKKPTELDPAIGESLSIILMKALNRDPAKRFQTVEGLLKAFRNIHKYDTRYRHMLLKQELLFLAEALCVGIGVLAIFFGRIRLEQEREDAYVQAVAVLSDAAANSGDLQQLEEFYENARRIMPERLEAYLQKAVYLYQSKKYEEDIAFIEETVLSESGFREQEAMADIYFILGNCCFEEEQYENAVIYYRTAIERNGENPDYYRDYVISLVRLNQNEKAKEALEQAQEKGISSVDLCLINGEMKKAEQDYEGAEQDLKQCIADTDDDYLRMRAYVILDMAYREEVAAAAKTSGGTEYENQLKYLIKSEDLLEEARTRVGLENQLLIYERLAQTYIDLEELTDDSGYGEKAIGILQEIVAHGWGTYVTYNNICILYQKIGRLEDAEAVLGQMLEMAPENYNTYKRLAFLEVEKQNQKKNADRSYQIFLEYYEKAKKLFAEANTAGGDVEMQLLDNLYQQLAEGGWLK